MAKLKRARSRICPSTSNRVLIDQTCFGRRGGLAPISLPLFQGMRWLPGTRFSLSGMVVLLRYKDDEHAPRMQAAKSCPLSECYGHENACARIGLVVSDPYRNWSVHRSSPTYIRSDAMAFRLLCITPFDTVVGKEFGALAGMVA